MPNAPAFDSFPGQLENYFRRYFGVTISCNDSSAVYNFNVDYIGTEIMDEKTAFLIRAENYALARGDEMWFKNLYTYFRECNDITDSVWKTLAYMYSVETADLLEFQ